MSTFSVRSSFSCLPMEETTFTDTTQKTKTVHSLIDKGISGSIEKTFSTLSTNVQYYTGLWDFHDDPLVLSDALPISAIAPIKFIAIAIVANGTSYEDNVLGVEVKIGTTIFARLRELGDFAVLPLNDVLAGDISLESTLGHGGTVEMIVGLT